MEQTPLQAEITRLWHTARVALAGEKCGRWERMNYVQKSLDKFYPELIKGMSSKELWFYIDDETQLIRRN